MRHISFLAFLLYTLTLSACFPSHIKKVESPLIPLERSGFSILPPKGENWVYIENDGGSNFDLRFFKDVESPTYRVTAAIKERHRKLDFTRPQEFLSYIKNALNLGLDPLRFNILEQDIALNDRFGTYCVRHLIVMEDHESYHVGNNPFLMVKTIEYNFLHPSIENLIISVAYSEIGKPDEISKTFLLTSENFFRGLVLLSPKRELEVENSTKRFKVAASF